MDLSAADRVWNRAVLEGGGPNALLGDRALADLMLLHGLAMNGGVLHALECLDEKERDAAVAGYAFYAFPAVSLLLLDLLARRSDDADADAADALELVAAREYAREIPSDQVIADAFGRLLAERPELFAPL